MKKNFLTSLGLVCVLTVCFFVFKRNLQNSNHSNSPIQIKSETIHSNPQSIFSEEKMEEGAQPKDLHKCIKENGVCCKNKKESVPTKPSNREVNEKNDRLEALEDPDDIVSSDPHAKKWSLPQRFAEAAAIEFEKTKDPALGYVPTERLLDALEKTKRMQAQMFKQEDISARGALANVRWLERGPNNIGGRTRAIQVDLNDKTGNTVFAGGVTGGLYKVTDVSGVAKWEKVYDWLDNITISSIAQDPKNPQIMYIGTGDTDGAGAFVPGQGGTLGVGIYKSTDGGKTWNLLPATTIPRSASYQYVTKIIVTPDSGYVFAATFIGVFKSKDGGATWKIVLGGKTWDMARGSDGRIYAALQSGAQVSKSFGESGTFTSMAGTGFPNNLNRVQLACASSNPEVVYVVGALAGNTGSPIYRSNNAGATWSQGATPPRGCGGSGEFTSGQAWYDLTIAVDPLNETMVWVGGIEQWRSADGGANWQQMTGGYCPSSFPYAHVDQHVLHFDPLNPSVLYVGNDGGVFRVTNAAGKHAIKELNNGYTTTQFYACAIHPDSGSTHFLAGAQDNNSILVAGSKSVGNGRAVLGGDGFYCFIDQDNPNIQIASSQGGNWAISTNGGASFGGGRSSSGSFYCPADYDDNSNILYAQTTAGDLWRWKVTTNETPQTVDVAGVTLTGSIAQYSVDKNIPNRLYIGTRTGVLYAVDSANVGTTLANAARIGVFSGYISSIEVEKGNSKHILVCISSYGVNQIQETKDGGTTWTVCDGNLPDMPVRWGIFNPNDATQALIATDAGVWSTELLNGATTTWIPPTPGRGIPIVRTDMLQYRESDKMVIAGTYGRGLWTTNVFGKATPAMEYPEVSYIDVPVPFKGETSVAAGNFLWKFNDGTIDTLENTKKTYKQVGKFDVSLTINNNNTLVTNGKIQILPNLPTPYKTTTAGYAGNFDVANWDTHFGVWSASGSKFVRGKSGVFGKDGTHSGSFCYVLDPTAQTYQKGTVAYLHLPNYDMTQTGIYQFSFWANHDAQLGRDGLQVEYSLDKGSNWRTLGSKSDPNWYNYLNNSVTDGAFNLGESFISGTADDWTRFKLNISNLSGNPNVAFRFVFKSGTFAPGAGVAIDDVVITRYEGKNETAVITQSGSFNKAGNGIDLSFQTQPEYFAQYFDVEMSVNGRDWRKINTSLIALGGSTEELQSYTTSILGTPFDLYYFRVRSVNNNTAANYSLDFRTTPFVVKRNRDLPLAINKVYPSPFTSFIGVTFTDIPNADIVYDLFDVSGRLISSQTVAAFSGIYQELKVPNLPKAVYLLRIKIGDNKAESIKLFGGN